jgi:hypothetical protein
MGGIYFQLPLAEISEPRTPKRPGFNTIPLVEPGVEPSVPGIVALVASMGPPEDRGGMR